MKKNCEEKKLPISKNIVTRSGSQGNEDKLQVNLIFVDDERIKKLNSRFRCEDQVTDVLSFSPETIEEVEGHYLIGEVVIGLDQLVRQASEAQVSQEEELVRLVAHGVLHLLGYEDDSDESKKEMFDLQEKIVKEVIRSKN